eukprot:m.119146 g.119146  ORF g.119146 m.119146 type:complete len:105 (+) comp9354_c0_seq6:1199-1513(+)
MGSSKWRASSDASRAYTRCITIHTTYCVHNAFFQPFPSPTSGIACIHYHGDYIASGSSDKSIIIWEVKTGNIVRKLLGLFLLCLLIIVSTSIDSFTNSIYQRPF